MHLLAITIDSASIVLAQIRNSLSRIFRSESFRIASRIALCSAVLTVGSVVAVALGWQSLVRWSAWFVELSQEELCCINPDATVQQVTREDTVLLINTTDCDVWVASPVLLGRLFRDSQPSD